MPSVSSHTMPSWRLAFWLCLTGVLILALLPPAAPMPSTGWDKSNHLLAFATLAVLGWRGYPGRGMAVVAGLLAFGVLIEALQWLTPYRDADWRDVFADSVGIALGAALHRLRAVLATGRSRRPS